MASSHQFQRRSIKRRHSRRARASLLACYDYTRSGNPTRTALQLQLARIEQAQHAFTFTSGMAALTVVTQLIDSGTSIICGEDSYGGTVRLLSQVIIAEKACHFVDLTDLPALERSLQRLAPSVKLIMAESPTNPLMKIIDIRAVAELAHRFGRSSITALIVRRCRVTASGPR